MSSSNGETKDALANSGTANALASGYNKQAGQTGNTLGTTLTRMATNPQGYSPQDVANQTTAAMQSYGGSQAGTVGQANQMAARTNNAGGFTAALDNSARGAAAGLSQAALGVQNQNANLKIQQQQDALRGLGSMYGEQVGAGENALGLSNSALQVANQGKQVANANPWSQMGRQALAGALQGAAKGA